MVKMTQERANNIYEWLDHQINVYSDNVYNARMDAFLRALDLVGIKYYANGGNYSKEFLQSFNITDFPRDNLSDNLSDNEIDIAIKALELIRKRHHLPLIVSCSGMIEILEKAKRK